MSKNSCNFNRIKILSLLCIVLFLGVFYLILSAKSVSVKADEKKKEYKWTKITADEETTIDAQYLWPEEQNPLITAVYRNGIRLETDNMYTITKGTVYHFRGRSDDSVLYTQVYVGTALPEITKNADTWYRLLPSAVRENFENDGWEWDIGWEYGNRAELDYEEKRLLVKDGDDTAVLYGIGMYLNNKYNYETNIAFQDEYAQFTITFGSDEDLFAGAFENYYTKSGELKSKCPKIYALVSEVLSQLTA